MRTEFYRTQRKAMRNVTTGTWHAWHEIWGLIRGWLKTWDLADSLSASTTISADNYLEIIQLFAEYMNERPSHEIFNLVKIKVEIDVKFARREVGQNMSVVAMRVLEVGDRCLQILSEVGRTSSC